MALALEEYLDEAISNREFYYAFHNVGFDHIYVIRTDEGTLGISEDRTGLWEISYERPFDEVEVDSELDWHVRIPSTVGGFVQLGAQHPDGQ